MWSTLLSLFPGVLAACRMLLSKRWDPCGQHCLVTGGSSGLGLALAVLLAKRGAHVSIVARNQQRLDQVLKSLEASRQNQEQVFGAYSFAVDSEAGSFGAIKAASKPHGGRCPDAFFLVAGAWKPGFFLEQTEASIKAGIQMSYYAQVFTALVAAKEMVKQGIKGRIVFTASVLGYFSFAGWGTYSPTKFALRGLAETLRSEFLLYGIKIHIAFPATILTPGYEQENIIKPKVTLKIEETDSASLPEHLARAVLKGVEKGSFHITSGFIGNVLRATMAGSSPRNNYLVDIVHSFVGFVAFPLWRRFADNLVERHREEHYAYLHDKGFLGSQ